MKNRNLLKTVLLLFISLNMLSSNAQSTIPSHTTEISTDEQKPYKILTNGKKITIQSKQNIRAVLVWTASGHRIVEQKKINNPSFSFTITVKEKVFFIMVEMDDGKRYTSRIGVH